MYYALVTGLYRRHKKDIWFVVNESGKVDGWYIKYRYHDRDKKLRKATSHRYKLTELEGKQGIDIKIVSEHKWKRELFLYLL